MKKLYWTGLINGERSEALSAICSTIDKYAIILNFQRFSDLSIGLMIETSENSIGDLFSSLNEIMYLEGNEQNQSSSEVVCIVMLNITFTKGEGDMLIEIPDFPD